MFEDVDLFEDADVALLKQILDRELCDTYEQEITEAEYLRGRITEHRQAPNLVFARDLSDPDLNALSDAEAMERLVQVEAGIARAHSLRARLVGLLAAHRPASADRPDGHPSAAGRQTRQARKTATSSEPLSQGGAEPDAVPEGEGGAEPDEVPEVLDVSEWLAHELQMAHPYSWTAAQDLVETSLVLTGRLSATLELLRAGRIDFPRARIMADLLGTCGQAVAHAVEAMVLPRAPGQTPGGLATAIRRALTRVDAAALRRRHAQARKTADVGYYPTQDGMARLVADLPLPVAAACVDAIAGYAREQQSDGDGRPVGQIRTEILTDLILRPWDTTRPPVTADVTIHLTIPTTPATGTDHAGLNEDGADAEVDGQIITAAHCRELLSQLEASRLFLALHDPHGGLTAVATPAQLRRASRRNRRTTERGQQRTGSAGSANRTGRIGAADPPDDIDGADGPGLRLPAPNSSYRPTCQQARHVRTRDRTCRHFGCNRKATHADLDHHTPWPTGQTSVCNLCSYCRTHHRLKHQAPGWTRGFQPDGTLTITTPTGITRTTRPPGPRPPAEPEPHWPAPALPHPDPPPPATPDNDDPPPF
ncbi:MAG: 13E12 repeat family protein [Actinomycetota bacterium]|nr:13E12 repeat family protein [Actinomycetota bacterium]